MSDARLTTEAEIRDLEEAFAATDPEGYEKFVKEWNEQMKRLNAEAKRWWKSRRKYCPNGCPGTPKKCWGHCLVANGAAA